MAVQLNITRRWAHGRSPPCLLQTWAPVGSSRPCNYDHRWHERRKGKSCPPGSYVQCRNTPSPQYTFESLYSPSVEPTGIFLVECFPWYFCNLIKSSFLLLVHQPPSHPLKSAQRLRLSVSSFSQCHTSFGHRKFHSKMLLFCHFRMKHWSSHFRENGKISSDIQYFHWGISDEKRNSMLLGSNTHR